MCIRTAALCTWWQEKHLLCVHTLLVSTCRDMCSLFLARTCRESGQMPLVRFHQTCAMSGRGGGSKEGGWGRKACRGLNFALRWHDQHDCDHFFFFFFYFWQCVKIAFLLLWLLPPIISDPTSPKVKKYCFHLQDTGLFFFFFFLMK